MPFPPTFTDVWDVTQPPDTQLANLLGQDIRNLKLDIMQRLSLLSGTFANRPTPEIINATWGGAGFGILYFATDTGQVFQWNGAAWVDVTVNTRGGLLNAQASGAAIVGNGAAQVLYTYNLTVGVVGNLSGIRIGVGWRHTGNSNVTYALTLNGVTVWTGTASNQNIAVATKLGLTIVNTGAASGSVTQDAFPYLSGALSLASDTLAGLSWATAQTIQFTFNTPATDSVTPIQWVVELL